MKIRRKAPKAPPAKLPAYVIGYRGTPPAPTELKFWFDLEYGGPLKWTDAAEHAVASHLMWQALVTLALPSADADRWAQHSGWDHPSAATVVVPSSAKASIDLIVHGARLARGLTLLTQGTAFDPATGRHFNPSDWSDRRLEAFDADDHIAVIEQESTDGDLRQWLFTRGLRRFGYDELEYFHPRGLNAAPVRAMLLAAAAELILRPRATNVGSLIEVIDPPTRVTIVRHRTVSLADGTLIVRELRREPV